MTGFQSQCSSNISRAMLVMIKCGSRAVSTGVLMYAAGSFKVGG